MPDNPGTIEHSPVSATPRQENIPKKVWRWLRPSCGLAAIAQDATYQRSVIRAWTDFGPTEALYEAVLLFIAGWLSILGLQALMGFRKLLESLWGHYPPCKSDFLVLRLVHGAGGLVFSTALLLCFFLLPVGLILAAFWYFTG